jgi:hypothetical protein
MAGRKLFNEQDARRCLLAAKSWPAGLSAWARAHGVDGRSLNAWRVNLESRGAVRVRARAPRLVELIPTAPRVVTREAFVLRIGGVELEVGHEFDEQSLRRLIGLLKSC